MIVDCHTHIWQSDAQLGQTFVSSGATPSKPARATRPLIAEPTTGNHLAATGPVDKSIVLGFKSRYLHAEIPNQFVAEYVRKHPDKLIGFAGVDPTTPTEAIADMRAAQAELGLKGITFSPAR